MKKFYNVMATAALVGTIIAPVSAFAASDNFAATTPAVKSTITGADLGNLVLKETEATEGSVAQDQQITITLPGGVSFNQDVKDLFGRMDAIADASLTTAGLVTPAEAEAATAGDQTLFLTDLVTASGSLDNTKISYVKGSGNSKSFTIKVTGAPTASTQAQLNYGLANVDLDGASGEIKVNVYAPNTGFTNGDVTVAVASGAGTVNTALNSPTISRVDNQPIGSMRVAETRGATFENGDYIDFVLPSDFTFSSASVTAVGLTIDPALGGPGQNYLIDTNGDGYSRLRVKVTNASSTTPGFVTVTPKVNVAPDAELGDLNVTIKGDDVTSNTVVAAKVADFGTTVTVNGDPDNVYAGRADQDVNTLSFTEGIASSLLDNRTVVLELPSYAHWYSIPTVDNVKGDADFSQPATTIDNARTKLQYSITAGNSKSQIDLKDGSIFLDADAPAGPVKVTVSGTNGLTGEYTIGNVVSPVSVTADTNKQVKIGLQNQASGNIVIKEAAAGVLKNTLTAVGKDWDKAGIDAQTSQKGELVLKAPTGVTFASLPTVTIDGDLKLVDTGVKLNSDKNELTLPIDKASKAASTITLSNVAFTVDRTVPEGQISLDLTGSALDYVQDSNSEVRDAIVKADVASVVTPAPGESTANATFTIGKTDYTVNGVQKTLDVAPYTENGRTYLPIRFVAEALGVSDDNIIWNDATKTVTLINGNRIASFKVGQSSYTVNGAVVPMDAAAQYKQNRNMIPLRYAAQALGVAIGWDDATQTVTVGSAAQK